jgi:hypothetical protein
VGWGRCPYQQGPRRDAYPGQQLKWSHLTLYQRGSGGVWGAGAGAGGQKSFSSADFYTENSKMVTNTALSSGA